MTFQLKNGNTLDIPDSYGGYILSCGCGSGKTTMFKDIIKNHWEEGILYTVDSRKECLSMYHYIVNTIIPQEPLLNPSDVFMMFTKESDDKDQLKAEKNLLDYKQNPGILLSKKVVIIPHPRLFSDIPGYFLVYNPSLTSLPVFDGDFKALMNRGDLRKLILIDETPQFFKPFVKLPGWLSPMMRGCDEKGVSDIYNSHIKGMDYDPFKQDNKTKLSINKQETVLKVLPRFVPIWMGKRQENSYKIQFFPKDLVQIGMKTHLYLAEGAGDVLFDSVSGFKLIDVSRKYRSCLELNPFPFHLDRKSPPSDLEKTTFLNTLKGIIEREPGKSLIVVWKDFKSQNSLEDSEGSNESKWRDEVKAELLKMGIPESKFFITYYGASDCKSTNDYRECGSIICCGKWYLPDSSVEKLNDGYGGYCNSQDYNLYQYIQLVSRIGLRNNTGGTYRMYYSEDFLDKGKFHLGDRLKEYINNNKLIPSGIKTPQWVKSLDSTRNGKSQRGSIEKLIEAGYLNEDMLNGKGNSNSLDIKLSELSSLIPHCKKPRKSDYDFLVKVLRHLGITMNIK